MTVDNRVLVVDDIVSNRYILVTHLKKQGITNISEAENGQQALEQLKADQFDLVLLDVMMPEVDGYEVLEQMKADKKLRDIPVIMITALDDMKSTVKCIESGAADYLLKPFNPVLFRARVSACLEKKHLRDVEREYLRLYDFTTGLPNRYYFLKQLGDELRRWQRHPSLFCVLLVRLGRHRMILDSLGREAGDKFLVAQGKRLVELLRSGTLLARLADNEFAVFMNDIDSASDGTTLAHRIHHALEKPLNILGHEISDHVNIGLAYSLTGYDGPEDMLRDAGLAANKVAQKGGYQIFDNAMHEEAMKRLDVESELKLAISERQLRLFYQPIIEFSSGKINGFEALIRWHHPTKGIIPPLEFIPLAEETGLIVPIGIWVLEEACRQASEWDSLLLGKDRINIGVNVSAYQFTEIDFLETVKNALDKAKLEGSGLKLELTETALIDNPDRVEHILNEVKKLNIKTALDDYGTGYCSLSYLHRFPFGTLKIDQSFVRNIENKPKNHEIVHSTIALAHKLGMDVIAEGIETNKEAKALCNMNCDYGQGMLFQPPLPVEDAENLLLNGKVPSPL